MAVCPFWQTNAFGKQNVRPSSTRFPAKYPPKEEVVRLYVDEGLSDAELGRHYGKSYQWAFTVRRHYDIAGKKPADYKRPPKRKFHSHGYILVGSKYEHRIVMEEKLGRKLRPGEVVHHIDGNKTNNAPDNLEVFASNAEHMKSHHRFPAASKSTADYFRYFNLKKKGEDLCRVCGARAECLHHALPRSLYPRGRRDLLNGLPLCYGCHNGWHLKMVTIYRDVFREDEWEYLSSAELSGQRIEAWLDDHYPAREQAGMAELADAPDSKSGGPLAHEGSIPSAGTNEEKHGA